MPNNCYLNRNFNRYGSTGNRCGNNICGNCNTCTNYESCPSRNSLRSDNYDTRDNCNSCNSCDVCERKQLLDDIRAYAFAIIDVGLYLDTNPNCELALEYYNTYRDLHKEAVELYEANFGPLSIYGNQNDDRWEWNCAPWPWEGGDY